LHNDSKPSDLDLQHAPLWPVFEQSRIPMALVDRDRCFVEVNEALLDLYEYTRAEVLGTYAGGTAIVDRTVADAEWEALVETGELYGERVIEHVSGTQLSVSYAAHATTVGERWMALCVTVSARSRPSGQELLGPARLASLDGGGSTLTGRELEVVRLVALGCATRSIADDLGVSRETVRTHVRNAMAKTGAHTRAELVAQVLADGLIEHQP
jgi:DNA-binding CsgD family transcriptional regulator